MRRQQARIVITACNETRETVESAIRNLGGLATRVTAAAVKFSVLEYTARRAFDAASSAVKAAYRPVEEFKLTTTKVAAMISSMQGAEGPQELADNFLKAKGTPKRSSTSSSRSRPRPLRRVPLIRGDERNFKKAVISYLQSALL